MRGSLEVSSEAGRQAVEEWLAGKQAQGVAITKDDARRELVLVAEVWAPRIPRGVVLVDDVLRLRDHHRDRLGG